MQKTVKCCNVSKCNLLSFILDLSEYGFFQGMYLKSEAYI